MPSPKISAIIPHWPLSEAHDETLRHCVASMPVDEKIVVVNEGTGMGRAINLGCRLATGDYFLITNNDCIWRSGEVASLISDTSVSVPRDVQGQQNQPRSFYCISRQLWEETGGYDEQFELGYFEDDDLLLRWQQAGIGIRVVDNIAIEHDPGTTMNSLPDRNAIFKANEQRFVAKWGGKPHEVYKR